MTTPLRDDNVTTTAICPVCRAGFRAVRRQRYCTQACRQAAYRARHPSPPPAPPVAVVAATRRREVTVYTCPHCEQRYLGEQWCPDCQRPCTRVGLGGLCPHCDEPVAVEDLLEQHSPPNMITNYDQTRSPNEAGSQ